MRALVAGMGASGLSMARHLQDSGYAVWAVDNRAHPPSADAFASLPGVEEQRTGEDFSRWRKSEFDNFARVAKSPGVPLEWIAAPAAKITGDAALFAESWAQSPLPTRILAVTGTNGKSTVTAMSAAMCTAAGSAADTAGNIGEPLLDALARWRKNGAPAAAAVELSSFQLETADSFPSDAAVVLNVSPDHLDRHRDFAGYAKIKSRIYRGAACRVVNLDDETVTAMLPSPEVTYSARHKAIWRMNDDTISGGDGEQFLLSKFSGQVPPSNALAALALVSPLKLMPEKCAKALASFAGLPHRYQQVGEFNGVLYVDDSKATNVESTCFALRQTKGDVVLIAGGDGKGQDFSPLAAASGRVRHAVLLGRDAPLLAQMFTAAGITNETVAGMQVAVQAATAAARKGDAVLLSPACSSLDMYENYAARGEEFAAACRKLAGGANRASA